ncbi:MAG TPA: UDP-3-O-acyl-N-acetylglucosamine deacetylase [Victivallales bacterium]|nr:UDP-3-O-acyl-N-acetylglucosamine deacetylase [Victivallales bacterium]
MKDNIFGKIIVGNKEDLRKSYDEFSNIPIDLELQHEDILDYSHKYMNTIAESVEVSAPGTFDRREVRKIKFEPTDKKGWWFNRTDLDLPPVQISHKNAYALLESGVNNIVIKGKNNINYMRLIEHIIALKLGTDIDNLMISVDSNDPPLFEKGSIELIEALEDAERVDTLHECKYYTVKKSVSAIWPNGSFLIVTPPEDDIYALKIDCAVNFNNCLAQQRIKFPVNDDNFKLGAEARTNAYIKHAFLCKTIGKFFSKTRNLGYNSKNVILYGKNRYFNTPNLMYNGKSLEVVWHRAILDLLAAFALIDEGRFVGHIISYKAGHREDVEFIKKLYTNDLLVEVTD